jgi:aminoglycoside 3-N-acetyltransferase
MISGQSPLDVYAPLDALARSNGAVLLAGVGIEKMTLLHWAEKASGRTLFRRWANDAHGQPVAVEVGGCSGGFSKVEPHFQSAVVTEEVGQSEWKVFSALHTVQDATLAIQANPNATHCGDVTCERCNDASAGGPLLGE